MNREQMRNESLSMIENIDPACVSNCTIDLLNVLKLCYLIDEKTFNQYADHWEHYTTKAMLKFWHKLAKGEGFSNDLNTAPGREESVKLAVLQCQLAILYSHRAVCAQEVHKLARQ